MVRIFQTIKAKINSIIHSGFYRKQYGRATTFIKRRPLTAFFIALALLFLVILAGNILNRPKVQNPTGPVVKSVHTFNIGEAPKATFQAKVDQAGVIKIVALSGGVVQEINVNEGDTVYKGTQIVSLSSNYQGGNAPAIQAQIADAQYQNVLDTFDQQKDAIQKQRDIANFTHDNFIDQQNIASQSANETNSLINSNQTILDSLNQQLSLAQGSGASQSAIIQQQSAINQLQGGQNQLRAQLRSLQEQTDCGKPPCRLADAQRDLTLKQLDVQQKSLELNKEISGLQANLAEVNAATMFPTSPFTGTVERIYVRVGQQVTPGTPLAEIVSNDKHATALVMVPNTVAQHLSTLDSSTIYLNKQPYSVRPIFISSEPTDGSLFTAIFPIPDDVNISVNDGEYVPIDVPVGASNSSAVFPFVPLDAIYQTQDSNYLLVMQKHKAVTRQVTLGNVFGSYIEVTKGLQSGDRVILERNIVAGDSVTSE